VIEVRVVDQYGNPVRLEHGDTMEFVTLVIDGVVIPDVMLADGSEAVIARVSRARDI